MKTAPARSFLMGAAVHKGEEAAHEIGRVIHCLLVGLEAARPLSTRRRMASERSGLSGSLAAHFSIASMRSADIRKLTIGALPVAGRPLFLGMTFLLDLFILVSYLK